LRRREFLTRTSVLGAASMLAYCPNVSADEPPPEIKTVRLVHAPAICLAPQYLAEELLRLEGFSEVRYVSNRSPTVSVADGEADFTQDGAPSLLPQWDAGRPIIALSGVHVGCFELFVNERVRSVRDLRGKTIAVAMLGSTEHLVLSSMLGYVGIDPRFDVNWLTGSIATDSMALFVSGKADAIMAFAPQPQALRAMKIGHGILNTAMDRPWSQYYCCVLLGRREFVTKYPIATKRVLRAFMKAADICANEPEQAARMLVAKGYEPRYSVAFDVLKELPYNRWREANPEDTLRFYGLRLREVGMIKSNPEKLIAHGTDWRFLNELKKEMKA